MLPDSVNLPQIAVTMTSPPAQISYPSLCIISRLMLFTRFCLPPPILLIFNIFSQQHIRSDSFFSVNCCLWLFSICHVTSVPCFWVTDPFFSVFLNWLLMQTIAYFTWKYSCLWPSLCAWIDSCKWICNSYFKLEETMCRDAHQHLLASLPVEKQLVDL